VQKKAVAAKGAARKEQRSAVRKAKRRVVGTVATEE
jgi:hypothetical protein